MDEKINGFGIFASIVVTVVGIGIFSYPRELTEKVGTDGWLVTLFSTIISILVIYIICFIIKSNSYKSVCDIFTDTSGKFLGYIFSIIFIFSNIFSIAIGLRIFTEVLKMYLLEKTPTELIVVLMILTGFYMVRGGTLSVVKFNEICFWLMFLPISIIIIFLFKLGDLTNVFPMFQNRPIEYMKAIKSTIYAFGGFEIVYLLAPMLKNRKKAFKFSFLAMLFVGLFYTIIIVLVISIFGPEETKNLLWSPITMVKCIDIPGTFVERWDGLIMALWVIFFASTFINGLNFAVVILKDAFSLKSNNTPLYILTPIIYLIALYPQNLKDIYNIGGLIIPPTTLIIYVIIPLFLITCNKIKKRRGVYEKK